MKSRHSLLLLWVLQVSISLYSAAVRSAPFNAGGGSATGADAVAIGESASATGDYSTAIGASSNANSTSATAIGNASRALSQGATSLGVAAISNGSDAIAIGSSSLSSKANSLAIGTNSSSAGDFSTTIGANSSASNANSIALGTDSKSVGVNSVAIGTSSSASNSSSIALGSLSSSDAVNSTAIGIGSNSSGLNSLALGSSAVASAENSVAIGAGSVANQTNQFSIGSNASNYSMPGLTSGNMPNQTPAKPNSAATTSDSTSTYQVAVSAVANGYVYSYTNTSTNATQYIKCNSTGITSTGCTSSDGDTTVDSGNASNFTKTDVQWFANQSTVTPIVKGFEALGWTVYAQNGTGNYAPSTPSVDSDGKLYASQSSLIPNNTYYLTANGYTTAVSQSSYNQNTCYQQYTNAQGTFTSNSCTPNPTAK